MMRMLTPDLRAFAGGPSRYGERMTSPSEPSVADAPSDPPEATDPADPTARSSR